MCDFLKNILGRAAFLAVMGIQPSTWGVHTPPPSGEVSHAGQRRTYSDPAGPSSPRSSSEDPLSKYVRVTPEHTAIETFLSNLSTPLSPVPLTFLSRAAFFPFDDRFIEQVEPSVRAVSLKADDHPEALILFDSDITVAFIKEGREIPLYLEPYTYSIATSRESSPASGEKGSNASSAQMETEPVLPAFSPSPERAPMSLADIPENTPSSMIVMSTTSSDSPGSFTTASLLEIFHQQREHLLQNPPIDLVPLLKDATQDQHPTAYLARHLFPLMSEATDASQGPRVRTWHYLNNPTVRTTLEEALNKPYTQILTEIFLPPELYTLSLPDPFPHRLAIVGTQLELAYLAPHLPVAHWQLEKIVHRWETILQEQDRKTEGEREEVDSQYLSLRPYHDQIHSLLETLEPWKEHLSQRGTEMLRNNPDPLFVTVQGIRNSAALETLHQQNTLEGFRTVGLLSTSPQEHIRLLTQSAALGNASAFVDLGHRERTAAPQLFLYKEAIQRGSLYAWVPFAQAVLKHSRTPLVQYLSGMREGSPPINLVERIHSSFFNDMGDINELNSFVTENLLRQEIPDFLQAAFNGLSPQDRLAARAYLKAAQEGWWDAYPLLAQHLAEKNPRSSNRPAFTETTRAQLYALMENAPPEAQAQRAQIMQLPELLQHISPGEYLNLTFQAKKPTPEIYEAALHEFYTHLRTAKELYHSQLNSLLEFNSKELKS